MNINPWKLSTFVLAAALAVVLALPVIAPANAGGGQPHMRAALSATKTAHRQLEKAAHNKTGHRVKAIALLEQAAAQIKAGMAAGKR